MRDLVCDEPDSEEKLNPGTVKVLTGNDTFTARDLFQKGSDMREIRPLFKLRLIGNLIPECTCADQAFIERLLPIPFKSEFLPPHEYKRRMASATDDEKRYLHLVDANLDAKSLAPGLAWLLLDTRRRYLGQDTSISRKRPNIRDVMPDEVIAKRRAYARDHDLVGTFIRESYTSEDCDSTNILLSHDVKRAFTQWADRNSRGMTRPKGATLDKNLTGAFHGTPARAVQGGFGWERWRAV